MKGEKMGERETEKKRRREHTQKTTLLAESLKCAGRAVDT